MAQKLVYGFGGGKADGNASKKDLLGGKGANLAEMTRLGIRVPPGFTISTRACNLYHERRRRIPPELRPQVERGLAKLEKLQRKRFGDTDDPLLVSVRSGAKFSMPGMMDTILNLGLNDRAVQGLVAKSGDARFAWDSYRRFIQMYAGVVLGVDKHRFESELDRLKRRRRVQLDTELSTADLEGLTARYKKIVRAVHGKAFPQDPGRQLWGAIGAVFLSWNTDRARRYRQQYGIGDDLGTAVNVQCMVFGNLGDDCATGVAFTRNPATGDNELYGEYLINAQGEDVVAGIRTPQPICKQHEGDGSLEQTMPNSFRALQRIRTKLEKHYRDMQDLEFTVERGKLYILQTRTGKRTGTAALHIAFDLYRAKRIDRKEILRRIEPEMLVQLLAPVFEPAELARARKSGRIFARGLPAGPGAASGVIALTAERAERLHAAGKAVLLVRNETSPEDIGGMLAAEGILTSRGGVTSHAAVVARGMGKPCVVGAEGLRVDLEAGKLVAGSRTLREGDVLSIDGTSGEIITGTLNPHPSEIQQVLTKKRIGPKDSRIYRRFAQLMSWTDRYKRLKIRANADTPGDSAIARALGAEGIGLCRTEHMFFGEDRIAAVREMILSEDARQRARALRKLLPMQRRDFVRIFTVMDGLPVTIRLLDPPLHEFLPTEKTQFKALAREMGLTPKLIEAKVRSLEETNPMLGHRGCRLGITFPDIYEMQARAIFQAAAICRRKRIRVKPEVMIPLIGTVEEYRELAALIHRVAESIHKKTGQRPIYQVGTMIEIPRACLVADQIASEAEFFSFGTNDLTQLTYGYSRDDVGKFLPDYLERRMLPADPFQTLDAAGVGQLVSMAIESGRKAHPRLKVGVCGEHGGDPASVRFFHDRGVDYVSCSPYRVPVARLAAAQAVLSSTILGSTA